MDLIDDHVDVLFANHHEVMSLFEVEQLDVALDRIQERVELAAITMGASGSVLITSGGRLTIQADPVARVVDKTGAGDLYTAELEKTELAALEILHINLNQYVQNKEKTAAYEIYIPQRVGWPYSSPNRTLLSIESGFIPLDFGYFSDHTLNQVALTVDDTDSITRLLAQDLEKNFIELDERIMSYNQAEKNSLEKFKGFLNPLL